MHLPPPLQSQPSLSWSPHSTLGLGLELPGEAQYIRNEAEGVYPWAGDQSPGYLPAAYALHSSLPELSHSHFHSPGLALSSPEELWSSYVTQKPSVPLGKDQRLWLSRAKSRLQSCPSCRGFVRVVFVCLGCDQHS